MVVLEWLSTLRAAMANTRKTKLINRPQRIQIKDDVLLLDEVFLREVLAKASRRTGRRLEQEGLPFVMVAGAKYRPLKAGQEWLADRITRKNKPAKPRRA